MAVDDAARTRGTSKRQCSTRIGETCVSSFECCAPLACRYQSIGRSACMPVGDAGTTP